VFPEAPVRQFALTFPFPLRLLLAAHPKVLNEVLAVVQRGISTFLVPISGVRAKRLPIYGSLAAMFIFCGRCGADLMEIRPIRTEADHRAALARIGELMGAEANSPEGDELDILATLVEVYEQKHFAIEAPDPVEFLKNVMEFLGLEQNELASVLRSRSRASEILNRRRPLTLDQIRRISSAWQVPTDPLINEYEVARGT
jgi:HTH-type transcriptional regulator/antitoxin HigA